MKIPKALQLPSGSWHIQLRNHGNSISITEATKEGCEARALEARANWLRNESSKAAKSPRSAKTLEAAFNEYIDLCRSTRSPSTIRAYTTVRDYRFAGLMKKPLSAISEDSVQHEIDAMTKSGLSPKSIKNAYGLLRSVLKKQRIVIDDSDIKRPAVIPKLKPRLEKEQIYVFMDALDKEPAQIRAIALLAMRTSMRRSEICALEWSDFSKDFSHVRVTKALVPDENNVFVVKNGAKNAKSNRICAIPPWLAEDIKAVQPDESKRSRRVFSIYPNQIWTMISNICKKNGLPHTGIHDLRHSFAAISGSIGIPKRVTMKMGGWSNEQTLDNIYDYEFSDDIDEANKKLDEFLFVRKNKSQEKKKKPKKI